MAITILLCSTGVLPIYLGIALVMGENIGTTATANLAALGSGTQARRAALAHLLFNVFGVIWVLLIFYPFVDMVCKLVGYDPAIGGQAERLPVVLAMFHTCFNVTNTAILIWFIPQLEKAVCKILPEKVQEEKDTFKLRYIRANLIQTPEIAVLQAEKETSSFAENTREMFADVQKLFLEKDEKAFTELFTRIEKEEDMTDRLELEIARYLEQVGEGHLSDDTKMKIRQMMREVSELESIGDACYNLARMMRRRQQQGYELSSELILKVQSMMALCDKALEQMCNMMHGHPSKHNIHETYQLENNINQMRDRLKSDNIRDVNDRKYSYTVGTLFGDMVGELEKLGDYVVNVVEARVGQ